VNPYRVPSPPPREVEIVYLHRSSSMRLAALVGAIAYVSGLCTHCLPREAKEALADSTYLADQMRCVDNNDTRETIDACRKAVRERWGIAETVRDGGGQ